MGRAQFFCSVGRILLTTLLLAVANAAAHAQGGQPQSEIDRLNEAGRRFYEQGKYDQAIDSVRRSYELAERQHGPRHPLTVRGLNNLGVLLGDVGRHAEAVDYHKRALALREQLLGPEHIDVAQSLNNLANIYRVLGQITEAEQMHRRALAIREKVRGPDHPDVAQSLANLALLHEALDQLGEAEALNRRALAIRQKARGPNHPDVATSLRALALNTQAQGRYRDAEPLLRKALSIREQTLGREHHLVGSSLLDLGENLRLQGHSSEAETLYKRALVLHEKAFGPEHISVALDLDLLGSLYRRLARPAEAEPLLKRSLMIREKVFGPDHRLVASSVNNLAELYRAQRRFNEAERLYKQAISIQEKVLGPHHRLLGNTIVNLAELYRVDGRYADAQPLYERGLAIHEQSLPPDHPDISVGLSRLAGLYRARGRFNDAEPLLRRALAIRERALGPTHPGVAYDLNNLAALALERGDWAQAARYWRRSTEIVRRRAEDFAAMGGEGEGDSGEVRRAHWQFRGLVKAVRRAGEDRRGDGAAAREMFEAAQWAQGSEAAASVAQMAARGASNDPALGGLVRERQDLMAEWRLKDKQLTLAKSMTPEKRKLEDEGAIATRLAAIDARIMEIDQLFATHYPEYSALASTRPISVADVQAGLREDEALVLFFDAPEILRVAEETFVWVVTRNGLRWVRSELGIRALSREVTALRCGLDMTTWTAKGSERCAALLGLPRERVPTAGQPLPFDVARAHKIYAALFGEVQDLIRDKHLLIVASGPLAQLPFQVLATRPPAPGGDLRSVSWLTREHAVTMLPAVASLKALRRIVKASAAPLPMIGFGNPLLEGPDNRYAPLAKLARDTQRCPSTPWRRRISEFIALQRGVDTVVTRGGFADPAHLRHQTPLPETAHELCAVARDVRADIRDLRLGARATEREVKTLSLRGDLMRYRIVHFATHGTLAGQLAGVNEPGLILTPPGQADDDDDGYLSASEIAALRLDAEWVILSACNTAAGSTGRSEALSGLARAFIYAGARALLVSHWAVDSDATVKLVTAAVREMARDPRVGRGEALRRATLALIDYGEAHEAHPAYWAPFVVVGEGGAQR